MQQQQFTNQGTTTYFNQVKKKQVLKTVLRELVNALEERR
jgi:hypothetical protein